MRMSPPVRLGLVMTAIGLVWGVILPRLGRFPVIVRHVVAMESREVNPAAMYYTELDRLPVRSAWVEEHLILWP